MRAKKECSTSRQRKHRKCQFRVNVIYNKISSDKEIKITECGVILEVRSALFRVPNESLV